MSSFLQAICHGVQPVEYSGISILHPSSQSNFTIFKSLFWQALCKGVSKMDLFTNNDLAIAEAPISTRYLTTLK